MTIPATPLTETTILLGGAAYPTLADVPWEKLTPWSTILLPYGQYKAKLLLSESGLEGKPIQIKGLPGPNGERPQIIGQDATTRPSDVSPNDPSKANGISRLDRGLITITPRLGEPWGYRPSWITLSGLEIRGAYAGYTYTDATGQVRKYTSNAAGVYCERGCGISLVNCAITDCGNGFFVASGADVVSGVPATLSEEILVDGCEVYGNGTTGGFLEHNVYVEARGVTIQNSRFLPLRSGAGGNNIKDRSSGLIVRGNWIEGGGHLLDLVDSQNGAALICQDPAYLTTFVYGNVLYNGLGGATYLMQYGGDSAGYPVTDLTMPVLNNYRNGTLYFYNNTVVNIADQTGTNSRWRTILCQLPTNKQIFDCFNNVLFNNPVSGNQASQFCLTDQWGRLVLDRCYASNGWSIGHDGVPFNGPAPIIGSPFFSESKNNCGFANLATKDFHLVGNSVCLGEAVPLPSNCPAPTQEPGGATRRTVLDLGAFETSAAIAPPPPPPVPPPVKKSYSFSFAGTDADGTAGKVTVNFEAT